MENYKIYPELSNYHCMHRLLAKPSVLTSSSALRSLPRSTRTKRGTRPGTQTWCLINLGPKRMFQARGQKSPNALRTCGICSLQIWARQKLSERVKNYASVGDLCIIMVLSALGCCTLLSKFFESIIDSRGILNSLLNLCLAGWGVRLARRKITMFPETPSSPFVMRIGGINQVKYNYVETFKIPPSHAPWPNRALVVPEFIFIGGRQYSGRLGGSAVSCGWHCAEN